MTSPTTETKDKFLENCVLAIFSKLFLKSKGLLAQAPPLKFSINQFQLDQLVPIQTWRADKLQIS